MLKEGEKARVNGMSNNNRQEREGERIFVVSLSSSLFSSLVSFYLFLFSSLLLCVISPLTMLYFLQSFFVAPATPVSFSIQSPLGFPFFSHFFFFVLSLLLLLPPHTPCFSLYSSYFSLFLPIYSFVTPFFPLSPYMQSLLLLLLASPFVYQSCLSGYSYLLPRFFLHPVAPHFTPFLVFTLATPLSPLSLHYPFSGCSYLLPPLFFSILSSLLISLPSLTPCPSLHSS